MSENKDISLEFTEEELNQIVSSITGAPANGYESIAKNKAIYTKAFKRLANAVAEKMVEAILKIESTSKTEQSKKVSKEGDTMSGPLAVENVRAIMRSILSFDGLHIGGLDEESGGTQYGKDFISVRRAFLERWDDGADEHFFGFPQNSGTLATEEKVRFLLLTELSKIDFIKPVKERPEVGEPNCIYLVSTGSEDEENLFEMWLWVNKGTEEEPSFGWEFEGCKKISADLEDVATNIEDGVGKCAVQQVADGVADGFDFTGKNAIAEEVDESLSGVQPYGAVGAYSSSFGGKSSAQGKRSHAEGTTTIAKGNYSHAEGDNSVALGNDTHAEGYATTAIAVASHTEGSQTATGPNAEGGHAEGIFAYALGRASHAEGAETVAEHDYSHAGGYGTKTGANYQTAIGVYNEGRDDTLFEIGNGEGKDDRSNAFEVRKDGTVYAGGKKIPTDGSAVVVDVTELLYNQDVQKFIELSQRFRNGECVIVCKLDEQYALLDGINFLGSDIHWSGTAFTYNPDDGDGFTSKSLTCFALECINGEYITFRVGQTSIDGGGGTQLYRHNIPCSSYDGEPASLIIIDLSPDKITGDTIQNAIQNCVSTYMDDGYTRACVTSGFNFEGEIMIGYEKNGDWMCISIMSNAMFDDVTKL